MNMGRDPPYLEKLKKYGAGDPTESDIAAVENELYNAPDRAAAIIMGSMVEKAIGKLLRNNMREEGASGLFKFSGVLGNFSAKIDIAYAFNLFGPKVKNDLDIIRHLRNQFAHSQTPIEFTNPAVKQCCDQLMYPDSPGVLSSVKNLKMVVGPLLRDHVDISRPRARYYVSCHEIIQRIYVLHIQLDG
jgi:hypothetical protein